MANPKRVLVVGNGAIGVAVASRLKLLGYHPVFVGRKGPVDVHVHFKGWGQSFWLDVRKLAQEDMPSIEGCFLAVKAYDLEGAACRFLPYLPSGTPVIALSNGYTKPILDRVANKFPKFFIRPGFCTAGVTTINDNHYELRSTKGGVYWGAIKNNSKKTAFEFTLSSVNGDTFFNYLDPIWGAKRMKWLFNTVMNSICAVREHPRNGALVDDVEYLRKVFDESYLLGCELWGHWPDSSNKLYGDLISLIMVTKDNENSMYRDVKLLKRTETDFLAGLAPDNQKYQELVKLHKAIVAKTPRLARQVKYS